MPLIYLNKTIIRSSGSCVYYSAVSAIQKEWINDKYTLKMSVSSLFLLQQLKCAKYWPDVGAPPFLLGDYTIVPDNEEKTEEYCTVRNFTLCKEVSVSSFAIGNFISN